MGALLYVIIVIIKIGELKMNCPYCHIDFATPQGFKAHKDSCFHAKNPLPEIKEEIKVKEVKKPKKAIK